MIWLLLALWIIGMPFALMAFNDDLSFTTKTPKWEMIFSIAAWPVIVFGKLVYFGILWKKYDDEN